MNKEYINRIARRFGLELQRFTPKDSPDARLIALLNHHQIDLVLDVGANDGDYGKRIRALGYAGKIVSFEPVSKAHESLVSVSAKDDLWEVAPRVAIGSEKGKTRINISRNSYSSSILKNTTLVESMNPDVAFIGSEEVELARLDSLAGEAIAAAGATFLKVDVQGFESEVLEGSSGVIGRISGVQVELSIVPNYEGQALYRELIDWLQARGFDLYGVFPGFSDRKSGRMLQMDGVFFRN